MKSPLHVLHLEDDPYDAAFIQATLELADRVRALDPRAKILFTLYLEDDTNDVALV